MENGKSINDGGWIKYKTGVLILEGEYIKLKSMSSEFHYPDSNDELVYVIGSSASPSSINLIKSKTYSQAYFKNYSDIFYFMTYNNVSDFISGYSNSTTSDYHNIGGVQVKIISEFPFEFLDEIE